MVHKITLLINCTLLAVCMYLNGSFTQFAFINDLQPQFQLSDVLLFLPFVVLFLFISFLFVFIISLIKEVKVGHPHLDSLTIAYKYGLSNALSSSVLSKVNEHFPTKDKVQICYERRVGPFGIAYGAIINSGTNQISDEIRAYITGHGYRLLQTKPISNAMYISCPTMPWFSYFGVWLVLSIIYPKMYKYSKKHALSAYPVVEVYRKCSVSLMAPLSRQDYFVVPEAESSLNRSSSCTNLSFTLAANRSYSTNPSMSHSTYPPGITHANKTVKLNSVPKVANGTSRQG